MTGRVDRPRAMILAAGEGTRLRPLTLTVPKVMVEIGGVPLIDHQTSWLKRHGIREIAINLHHLGEKVQAHMGDGSAHGIRMAYSWEDVLLGTAGAVKKMEPFFGQTLVVLYGDVLTDLPLSRVIEIHRANRALATIVVMEMEATGKGVIELDASGRVTRFEEKPSDGARRSSLTNAGVYILEKEALGYVPSSIPADFGYDVFPRMVRSGARVFGFILSENDYLVDIGTLDKYRQANADVRTGRLHT